MRRILFAVAGVVCGLALTFALTLGWRAWRVERTAAEGVARTDEDQRVNKDAQKPEPHREALGLVVPAKAAPSAAPKRPIGVGSSSGGISTIFGRNGLGGELQSGTGNMLGASPSSAYGMGGLGTQGRGSGGGGIAYGTASAGLLGAVGSAGGAGYRAQGDDPAGGDTENYGHTGVNPFVMTSEDRLSTFGVDVDTASYTIARRKLLEGTLPPPNSVRVEEFLNYFKYQYPQPKSGALAVFLDGAPSPFSPGRHLLRVGVQGKRLSVSERKTAHLTFLVDVSGSMQSPDKLPLAKRALRTLVDNLRDGDTVGLVTYASGSHVVLPAMGLEHKAAIHAAIEELEAGGSTAMAGGIELAYEEAAKTLDADSVSRVIILSDGDANIGAVTPQEMLAKIAHHAKEGVTVSTVGFGMGNYKDGLMEQFADKGNGNHYYVDSPMEARRIFQEQLGGTLEVIAKDVKIQVEFDPEQVASYRLVGYENRAIADRDFRNDKVDAGEIGAGHTVTALYELNLTPSAGDGLATVRVRAKTPKGSTATEAVFRFQASMMAPSFAAADRDLRFAASVMAAAEIFRQSSHAKGWNYDDVLRIARGATPEGNAEREEFVELLRTARAIVMRVASR